MNQGETTFQWQSEDSELHGPVVSTQYAHIQWHHILSPNVMQAYFVGSCSVSDATFDIKTIKKAAMAKNTLVRIHLYYFQKHFDPAGCGG